MRPTEAAPAGAAGLIQVLSARRGAGWSSRDLASPHQAATGASTGVAPEYKFFAEENQGFTAAIDQPYGLFNPALSNEATEQTPYLRTLGACAGSCFRPLVTAANVLPREAPFGEEAPCEENNAVTEKVASICGPRFEGATADASHIVIRSAAPLTEGAPAGRIEANGLVLGSLYEWSEGRLQLISILPPDESGTELPVPVRTDNPRLGAGLGLGADSSARRAISADGAHVFWEFQGNLYMRDSEVGKSIQIDAAEPACPAADECKSGGGRFQIASADGSRVFFTDSNRLTSDSGASSEIGHHKADLYECRIVEESPGRPECRLADLTPFENGERADVQGDILGASLDGSSLYFVANGVLTHVPNAEGSTSTLGTCGSAAPAPSETCNLYLYRTGQGIKFLASLSTADEKQWSQSPTEQLTRVSPDGDWLAFMSSRPLTGYDNRDAASGVPDAEAFLYDADSGELHCGSCNPTGARPIGVEYGELESGSSNALPSVRGEWPSHGWVSVLLPHSSSFDIGSPDYQPRYLSDFGRLYFNSLDALVTSDTNQTGDVYQYEPPGVGSCTTAANTYSAQDGGCVDLISSGTSPQRSAFLDASESGNDVFFLSSSKLSPQDVDDAQDVYDAHSCEEATGCLAEPAAPTPPCTGEACQPEPPAPAEAKPQSQSFSGPGNPVTCRKGQVKKAGKCVKKQKKHKKRKKSGGGAKKSTKSKGGGQK
jgi:hypothetical protein